jgi:hypothetical protein
MNHQRMAYGAIVAIVFLTFGAVAFSKPTTAEPRYFRVCPASKPGRCSSPNAFVIALEKLDQINMAEDILKGKVVDKVHVEGAIVAETVPYNSPWKFHLDPKTISFFARAHPLCWGHSTSEIDANLDKVGTPGFLPLKYWCPRGYRVSEEVEVR